MRYARKICGAACSLLFAGMTAAGIALLALHLLGYQILAVKTGSMENVYPVGSVIIADASPPEAIQEGDVISFVADSALTVVTHRVVRVDEENQCFYTKGDQNSGEDENPVPYENLLGKVVFSIPGAGYIVLYAQGRAGRRILMAVIAGIVLFYLEQFIVFLVKRGKKRQSGLPEEKNRERSP